METTPELSAAQAAYAFLVLITGIVLLAMTITLVLMALHAPLWVIRAGTGSVLVGWPLALRARPQPWGSKKPPALHQ